VLAAESSSATQDTGVHDDGWTDETLLRFSSMGTKTSETVSRMLDVLSDEPGKDGALSTRELAERLDLDYYFAVTPERAAQWKRVRSSDV
jgi:hypothetical protein